MMDTGTAPAVAPDAGVAPAATQDTGTAPAAAAPSGNWYDSFPEDVRGYVQNKGWADPSAVVDSYRNAEKLLGVPADQVIKLPKSDASPEAWNDVWNKLGRPADPKGYGFQAAEGDTSGFSEWAGQAFHELGIPAEMGKQLAAKFGEFQQQVADNMLAQHNETIGAEVEALKKNWGAAHEQNVGIAQRAAQSLGIEGDVIDAMESAIGYAKTMEFFHGLGTKMGEGSFVSSGNGSQGNILSPEAAQSRIQELKKDVEWTNKYLAGDAKARSELAQLHRWAYPE